LSVAVKVTQPTSEVLVVAIDEGPRYRVRSLQFEDAAGAAPLGAEIRAHLREQQGQWFRSCTLRADLARLRASYEEASGATCVSRGRCFDEIEMDPETTLNPLERTVDLVVPIRVKHWAPSPHVATYVSCSGAEIEVGRTRGCTVGFSLPPAGAKTALDSASVEAHVEFGSGWTSGVRWPELVFILTNTSAQPVHFRFDEGCGEPNFFTATARRGAGGAAIDYVSWVGCMEPRPAGATCEPDGYDIELASGGTLRHKMTFVPVPPAARARCDAPAGPLETGTYEVSVHSPIPLQSGGWLTVKRTIQIP
jgi:hypothetical protein